MFLRSIIDSFPKTWIIQKRYLPKIKIPEYLLDRTVKPEEVLSRLTPEDTERLEFCMAEYQNMLEKGADVPKSLNKRNVLDLLCCTSPTSRIKFLRFLFKCEKRDENALMKKLEKVDTQHFSEVCSVEFF
ncbi:unnamed protein product [Schistosoma mattheei]|uniref:Uncharacterized protein n=1 Tax=Schistosoma mattheei TaxID=31246 RepID=A0A183PTP6_9TREM|nr:unnamed protein product [Schistosoma mattheei]